MSEVVYSTVIWTEKTKNETVDMTVDIYESADSVRDHDIRKDTNTKQSLQPTGSESKMNRSVTVCLVLLCVLLLTAVIVLCVLIYTNNQQFHIKNKQLTEEKNQLLTNYTDLTRERDELKAKYNNLTDLHEQLSKKKNEMLKYLNDGWQYNKSSFYYISSEWKSWNDSRRYCQERGADLIIINNKEEQDFVKSIKDEELVWIGLSDSDKEGTWKWFDNSTLDTSFWGFREPGGSSTENCAVTYISLWYDYPCTAKFKWICEKNIIK